MDLKKAISAHTLTTNTAITDILPASGSDQNRVPQNAVADRVYRAVANRNLISKR